MNFVLFVFKWNVEEILQNVLVALFREIAVNGYKKSRQKKKKSIIQSLLKPYDIFVQQTFLGKLFL